MGKRARIFFAGLGASFLFLAAVLVLARPASDDPSSRPQAVDPFSTMRVTLPAAAEPATAPCDALPQIHPAKDVQQAERQIEGENNQLDSGGPKKKRDLKAERRKRQAERRLQRKIPTEFGSQRLLRVNDVQHVTDSTPSLLPLSGHSGHGRTCCSLHPVAIHPSRTSASSKDISIQLRYLQSVQIRRLQLPHSSRYGGHAAARV